MKNIFYKLKQFLFKDHENDYFERKEPILTEEPCKEKAFSTFREIIKDDMPLPFDLDISFIDFIFRKRAVLEWRDKSILRFEHVAEQCLADISIYIKKETRKNRIIKYIILEPAHIILKHPVNNFIQSKIDATLLEVEMNMPGFVVHYIQEKKLNRCFINTLNELNNLSLTILNEERIIAAIKRIVFGKSGLLECIEKEIMEKYSKIMIRMEQSNA